MTLVGKRSVALLVISMAAGCAGPAPPSTPPPPTASESSSTSSPSVSPSISVAPIPLTEVRNHLLSTLAYVAEVNGDLEVASTPIEAANALEPLQGVLEDEQRWFDSHAASRTEPPVRAYGLQVTTTLKAVRLVETAGSVVDGATVTSARDAVASLLALQPAIEALGG